MGKDYYNILGVSKSASQDEIKRAFRKKAHEYHPDKQGGNEAKFKEVNEAYQVLGNPQRRVQYDQFGSTFEQAQARGGFSGFDGFRDFAGFANGFGAQGGQGGIHINMDDLGDMFSGLGDIFGFSAQGGRSGQRGSQRQRGGSIQMVLAIDFMEAAKGAQKEISFQKAVKCDKCNGNGAEPGTKIETCKICNGSGRETKMQRTILGNMQVQTTCSACQGEGKTYAKKCSKCSGNGLARETVNLKVKIPAGINNGETIRLAGEGQAGTKGAPAGDLYLEIRVRPDKRFERDGYDIKTRAQISFTQAALGDKIEVETVNGPVKLKIPAGTQSGTVFKLRGKGVTKLRGAGLGDHFVKVQVQTPTGLTRQQKKVLEELGI